MHSTTHIGVADREPHPDAGQYRDHARTTASTRRSVAALIVPVTRTAVPSGSTISMRASGSAPGSAGPAQGGAPTRLAAPAQPTPARPAAAQSLASRPP